MKGLILDQPSIRNIISKGIVCSRALKSTVSYKGDHSWERWIS